MNGPVIVFANTNMDKKTKAVILYHSYRIAVIKTKEDEDLINVFNVISEENLFNTRHMSFLTTDLENKSIHLVYPDLMKEEYEILLSKIRGYNFEVEEDAEIHHLLSFVSHGNMTTGDLLKIFARIEFSTPWMYSNEMENKFDLLIKTSELPTIIKNIHDHFKS